MDNTIRGYLRQIESISLCIDNKKKIYEKYLTSLEKDYGSNVYSTILYELTRLQIPAEIAQQHILSVIEHMHTMSKSMARNVGIYTACCDYFVNVVNLIHDPVLVDEVCLKQKEERADKDALTGLFNRAYFDHEICLEIERFKRFGSHFSLLMIDVDYFKYINDTYGHVAGDEVLKSVAGIFKQVTRIYDSVIRFGGDEFAVLLPQTSRKGATFMAERLRSSMERYPFQIGAGELERLTISVGISTYPIDALDDVGMMQRADQALYLAKRRRNCAIAYCDYIRPGSEHPQQLVRTAVS